jgi:DNA replication initiation complex subunit (GINS family)
MPDEMSFETLFEVLMRERNREELQRLEPGFFDDALTFILNEEGLVHPSNHTGFQRVRNLRAMLRDLYSRREQKIIRLATMSSRGSTGQVDRAAMLEHEKELFLELSQILESTRKRRLEGAPKSRPKARTSTQDDASPPKTGGTELVSIVFTAPVGKFMDEALEPHGPFEAGDAAALPEPIARILIGKGQAKRA